MNAGEIYIIKRDNFVKKVKLYFDFLISEYKFECTYQKNELSDKFEFTCDKFDFKVVLLNAYHPVDYGFEINLINLKTKSEEMIYYLLKENQDIEQEYLKQAAEFFKIYLKRF